MRTHTEWLFVVTVQSVACCGSWSSYHLPRRLTAVGCLCSEHCAGEEVRSTVASLPPPPSHGVQELCDSMSPGTSAAASTDYMNKIRKRLNEDASARVEREKRRRKVLVQQLTAHHAIEVGPRYDTIWYNTRCYFNVRCKAGMNQLNLLRGTNN